jgi:hypothetical protein
MDHISTMLKTTPRKRKSLQKLDTTPNATLRLPGTNTMSPSPSKRTKIATSYLDSDAASAAERAQYCFKDPDSFWKCFTSFDTEAIWRAVYVDGPLQIGRSGTEGVYVDMLDHQGLGYRHKIEAPENVSHR